MFSSAISKVIVWECVCMFEFARTHTHTHTHIYIYIYIYIYIHTHTHTHTYIYIYIYLIQVRRRKHAAHCWKKGRMNSWATFSYGPLVTDVPMLSIQRGIAYVSFVRISNAAGKTYQEQSAIGTDYKKESKNSVLPVKLDAEDSNETRGPISTLSCDPLKLVDYFTNRNHNT